MILARSVSGLRCHGLSLAGKLTKAFTPRRQFGFLDDQDGKAILDRKLKPATLADEPFTLQAKARSAGVQRTAKDFQ
jgi:hypothetical protein